jgi:hypothetical protein
MKTEQLDNQQDLRLKLIATALDDIEAVRIANENRLRQLMRSEPDEDGVQRGLGLTEDDPTVQRFKKITDQFLDLEQQNTKLLESEMKAHPLGEWVKNTSGIGLKQGARLIAAIGPIRWNGLHDRERTISELWAYAGLHLIVNADGHKIAARRQKGQVANWSADAKMRAYLVATSCIKAKTSPYRAVYDQRRAHTGPSVAQPEGKLHEVPCVRCGPSGKPAQPGTPWSPGHQHADALRYVSKRILRDMYLSLEPKEKKA